MAPNRARAERLTQHRCSERECDYLDTQVRCRSCGMTWTMGMNPDTGAKFWRYSVHRKADRSL